MTSSYVSSLTALTFFALVFNILACDSSVKRCEDDNDSETCAEFRIIETAGETTYALAEFSARSDTGVFSETHLINIDFHPTGELNLCGGSLESRAFYFSARDADGALIDREQIQGQPLYIRHHTQSVVENRDQRLFAVILRTADNTAYYVAAGTYQPSGELAVGKTPVNFYAQETNAIYYLISSDTPPENCALYSLEDTDPDDDD